MLFALAISACKQKDVHTPSNYDIQKSLVSGNGMVVSAHPLASEVGASILEQGGNAVDASIAMQLALAVVYPGAGNIGGGGFMVYRASNGEVRTLDYREKAPSGAHRDMYLDTLGNVDSGQHDHRQIPDGNFEHFRRCLSVFALLKTTAQNQRAIDS